MKFPFLILLPLYLAVGDACAESMIASARLKEIHLGMTMDEVQAVRGTPMFSVSGAGDSETYDVVFTDREAQGLLGETLEFAGYGPDHKLVAFGAYPQRPDAPASSRLIPYGRSDSLEAFVKMDGHSTDGTWGYTAANPIKVAGFYPGNPSLSEKVFLNALRGPQGEVVDYERLGSCCMFQTSNSRGGSALLDRYSLSIRGHAGKVELYLDMYDPGPRQVPVGFAYRIDVPGMPQPQASTASEPIPGALSQGASTAASSPAKPTDSVEIWVSDTRLVFAALATDTLAKNRYAWARMVTMTKRPGEIRGRVQRLDRFAVDCSSGPGLFLLATGTADPSDQAGRGRVIMEERLARKTFEYSTLQYKPVGEYLSGQNVDPTKANALYAFADYVCGVAANPSGREEIAARVLDTGPFPGAYTEATCQLEPTAVKIVPPAKPMVPVVRFSAAGSVQLNRIWMESSKVTEDRVTLDVGPTTMAIDRHTRHAQVSGRDGQAVLDGPCDFRAKDAGTAKVPADAGRD